MSDPVSKPQIPSGDAVRASAPALHAQAATRLTRSLLGVCLVLAVLYFARDLLIPIALAIFLSFLLAPLVRAIQSRGLPRIPSVMVVATITVAGLTLGGWFVGSQAIGLVQELPAYRENIVAKARALRESVGGKFRPVMQTIDAVTSEANAPHSPTEGAASGAHTAADKPAVQNASHTGSDTPASQFQILRAAIFPLLHPFEVVGLASVFLIFFLVYREDLRDRIIWVCGRAHLSLTTTALTDAGTRVSRYFGGLVLANGLHGLVVTIGLTLLGIPNALVFGVIAALLRFIPFLGPAIAAILPCTLALSLFDGWARPILVILLFILVDVMSANLLEPWLYGARTGASPTAIILSTVVWTWLWGGIGLVLATPITVCLVVLGKYVPQFQVLYVLLGDEPVLEPHARLYQRLLAMDRAESHQIVRDAAKNDPPEKVFSELVVPALSLLAVEGAHGPHDASRQAFADQMIDDFLPPATVAAKGEQSSSESGVLAPAVVPLSPAVVLIPAHGPHDELAARILARLREARGGPSRVVSPHLLIAELLEMIRSDRPTAICIVSVQAENIGRIELLCRRIAESEHTCPLLVGVWDASIDADRLRRRLSRVPRVQLSTTATETLQAIEAVHPSQLAGPAISTPAAIAPPVFVAPALA